MFYQAVVYCHFHVYCASKNKSPLPFQTGFKPIFEFEIERTKQFVRFRRIKNFIKTCFRCTTKYFHDFATYLQVRLYHAPGQLRQFNLLMMSFILSFRSSFLFEWPQSFLIDILLLKSLKILKRPIFGRWSLSGLHPSIDIFQYICIVGF